MENPFTHVGNNGTGYVTSEAQSATSGVTNADGVPTTLALILLGSGLGLYLLNKAGFRFVATAGAKGGF